MSLIYLHHLSNWHVINHCWKAGWRPGQELSKTIINSLNHTKIKPDTIKKLTTQYTIEKMERLQRYLESQLIDVMTIMDDDYPPQLREIAQPPWVLYLRGDRTLLSSSSMLAVVGSRKPTHYGVQSTKLLVTELVQHGYIIVSGLAYGIDATAHSTALKEQGKTIAVLGSGIDVIYPRRNQQLYHEIIETGLVISEAPTGTAPIAALFPQRNRIISGLSRGCLVIEAAARSGSLITAYHSLDQNREVFAVPGPISSLQSEGTLQLIQQGAKCVIKCQDILEEFEGSMVAATIETKQCELPIMEDDEGVLYQQIPHTPIDLSQLYEKVAVHFTFPRFHQAILSLEMKGYIESVPGMKVVRCK